jgi:hypothetical protein
MFKLAIPEETDPESEKMENEGDVAVNLLDAQFYDEKQLVLVLQTAGTAGTGTFFAHITLQGELNLCVERRAIGLFNFVDPEYHKVPDLGPSLDMEVEILQRFADGTVSSPTSHGMESHRFTASLAGLGIGQLPTDQHEGGCKHSFLGRE